MIKAFCVVAAVSLALLLAAAAPSRGVAQGGCTPHRVTVPVLQVLGDPNRPGLYVGSLGQDDIVCIVDRARLGPQQLGEITGRLLPGGGSEPLSGWVSTMFLSETDAPVVGSKPGTSLAPSPTKETAVPDTAAALEEGTLRFDEPVPYGPPEIRGRTLAELVEGEPSFPPIEGIPEDLWRKPCATCHSWNRERLCEQGQSYIPQAEAVFRHQHPYGGPYKLALMRWANSGCN